MLEMKHCASMNKKLFKNINLKDCLIQSSGPDCKPAVPHPSLPDVYLVGVDGHRDDGRQVEDASSFGRRLHSLGVRHLRDRFTESINKCSVMLLLGVSGFAMKMNVCSRTVTFTGSSNSLSLLTLFLTKKQRHYHFHWRFLNSSVSHF